MKAWLTQLAGVLLVILFVAGAGGLLLLARAQQQGLGAAMAAASIRSVNPPDGSTGVPLSGDIRAEYFTRPNQDPAVKLEPPAGALLTDGHWEATVYVIHYAGLRDDSQYHVELDQDQLGQKGEHKQVNVRWSFRTGTRTSTPEPLQPTGVASPKPSATATAAAQPLVWDIGPSNTMHAFDWSGKPAETIPSLEALQSPDGRLLWRRFSANPGAQPTGSVIDASGHAIATVPAYQQMMWADDSTQFCAIDSSGAAGPELDLVSLDGKVHAVGPIALPTAPAQSPALAACSSLSGQAIVVGQGSGYIWSLSMLSLRDGSVVYRRRYPNPVARLIASHDAQYVAEQLLSNVGAPPFTFIRQLPSGTQRAVLSGIVVQAFSWDGSLVAGGTSGNASVLEAQVIRWQGAQVIWSSCTCPNPSSVHALAEPEGTKLAIIASWNQGQNVSSTIVDATGHATRWRWDHRR